MKKRIIKVQELVSHTSDTNCLHVGRKSNLVYATGGKDKAVNVWTIGEDNFTLSLKHTGAVDSVSFDPEEQVIAAGSDSGSIRLFDLSNESTSRTFVGHRTSTSCLDFHPYGHVMVSGSVDTNIKLWDIRSRKDICTYRGHKSNITSVKISPHGRWVISAGADGQLKVWDITAGKVLSTLTTEGGVFTSLCFHPTEFLLATGSEDRTAKLWELDSFTLAASTPLEATPVTSVAFAGNGQCLFTSTNTLLKSYSINQHQEDLTKSPIIELNCADSIVANWGQRASDSARVSDLIVSGQSSLMAGVINGSLASMHVADLSLIAPIGTPPVKETINTEGEKKAKRKPSPKRSLEADGNVEHYSNSDDLVDNMTEDEAKKSFSSSLIPQPKDSPLGLDPSQFLPPDDVSNQSIDELVSLIKDQTSVLQSVLMTRVTSLKAASSRWNKDMPTAIKELVNRNDPAIINDLINALELTSSDRCSMDLEVCSNFLTTLPIVLESKFESHVVTGLSVFLGFVKTYGDLVAGTLKGPAPIGVDLEREARRERCALFARNSRPIVNLLKKHCSRSNEDIASLAKLALESCQSILP
ncbi:hypothetical protein P9112_004209 [Eukaryota sp. TZLM1-RC]